MSNLNFDLLFYKTTGAILYNSAGSEPLKGISRYETPNNGNNKVFTDFEIVNCS